MSDPMQTIINRMSLVMTISEDIVKACKKADFPPAVVEIFLRIHNQQVELEKAVNELRSIQLQMAQLLEMHTNVATNVTQQIHALSTHTGYQPDEQVTAHEIGRDET